MKTLRIPTAHAVSFDVAADDRFEITDPHGQQVADMVAFNLDDRSERFSPKYTHAFNGRLRVSTGDTLISTRGNPILTIIDDDCGTHDIIHGPGTNWLLGELENREMPVMACHENLSEVLEGRGIDSDQLFDVMNVFMKSTISEDQTVHVRPPESDPGDCIEFVSHQDVLVGVTACASETVTNAGKATPIEVTVPSNTTLNANFPLS